jgi:hypothetical protein
MTGDFLVADWAVAAGGYVWQQCQKKDYQGGEDFYLGVSRIDYLLAPAREANKKKWRLINLLALDQNLYLEFAALTPSLSCIKTFADKYGLLGINVLKKSDKSKYKPIDAEAYTTWRSQIREMYVLTTLWNACLSQDRETLSQYIHWQIDSSGRRIYFKAPPVNTEQGQIETVLKSISEESLNEIDIAIDSKGFNPRLFELAPRGDVLLPAVFFVRTRVTENLGFRTEEGGYHRPSIRPRLVWRTPGEAGSEVIRLALEDIPSTLAQALWLQIANAIVAGPLFRSCQVCKRWFAFSAKAPRTKVEFCSDACRLRAYRLRQDRARQMATAGKSFEEIALALGSDAATVRRWVTGLKE